MTLRKEKKLSQIELAKRIGVSSQVISNWERAYTTPTAYDIQKFTHALEIGPEKIIPGKHIFKTIDKSCFSKNKEKLEKSNLIEFLSILITF